jgi:1-acyl-sn-glycerol-3-phosphate acyltransferase
MKPMRFRTALLVLMYVVILVLAIPFLLLCMLVGRRDPLVAIGKGTMRLSRRILDIPLDVRGLESVDAGRPLVFMANHLSFLDGPLLIMLIPHPVRVIMKKSLGRIPILGLGMRFVGFLTVDRKGAREGMARIELAARLMKEKGYSFLLFPEGTRSPDGRLGPLRRGGFFLALEGGAPIVPIAIRGTYEMMPRGRWYVGKGRIGVDFLESIPVRDYTVETMPALMDRVGSAIRDSLEKGDA